jgi:hypothetical protein
MSPGYHWDWRSPSSVTHLRKVYFDEKKTPHGRKEGREALSDEKTYLTMIPFIKPWDGNEKSY